jgi:hypothetical protein
MVVSPRETLQALAAEANRLLLAGAALAAGNATLLRQVRALRAASRQVPLLGPIADAVDRVLRAALEQGSVVVQRRALEFLTEQAPDEAAEAALRSIQRP